MDSLSKGKPVSVKTFQVSVVLSSGVTATLLNALEKTQKAETKLCFASAS